ncbi:MAG: hypothetical protein ACAF41_23755 [Leptolyngbya sp. BL-A-14]
MSSNLAAPIEKGLGRSSFQDLFRGITTANPGEAGTVNTFTVVLNQVSHSSIEMGLGYRVWGVVNANENGYEWVLEHFA